ncbi:MAG: transaldolase [Nitrospiraceae bacterium]|nr:transaldolase [Nitrospiraceae bacterium]
MANPLIELNRQGQSVWLDYLSRDMLNSGELKRLIDEDGITGVTSNPSIFEKAITGGRAYDGIIQGLIARGITNPKEMFIQMAAADVADAAKLLRGVYDKTGGADGYVSIEVSPDLAYNAEATIAEARRLFLLTGGGNVYVKVPATKQGLPAIRKLVSEGLNINITLLFAAQRYQEVMDAYLSGLEDRISKGLPIDKITSVASFFVSRVDTLADKMLDRLYQESGVSGKEVIQGFYGKAAVANAKIAYKKYREVFEGDRFLSIEEKGGRVQRILWASTSTKNPAYNDIKYVEELVAPDSVNTMPENTIKAFKDHGKVRVSIYDGMEGAQRIVDELKDAGVDMDYVTAELESEGVKLFSDSYFSVLEKIAQKRDSLLSRAGR